jgi:hypothetical protein
MRRLVTFALGLVLAGCAAGTGAPAQDPSSPSSQRAEDLQGAFQLVFEVPRGTWQAGDAIDGVATLALARGSGVDLGGSGGGLVGFDFAEVDGSRHVEPAWTADCAPYRLDLGKSITSSIKKSGGFTAEQPDADFYRSFLTDPIVRLPAGDWKITAIASFIEGKGCSGQSHTMAATVLVHVTP